MGKHVRRPNYGSGPNAQKYDIARRNPNYGNRNGATARGKSASPQSAPNVRMVCGVALTPTGPAYAPRVIHRRDPGRVADVDKPVVKAAVVIKEPDYTEQKAAWILENSPVRELPVPAPPAYKWSYRQLMCESVAAGRICTAAGCRDAHELVEQKFCTFKDLDIHFLTPYKAVMCETGLEGVASCRFGYNCHYRHVGEFFSTTCPRLALIKHCGIGKACPFNHLKVDA